jgi:hypothetical protein
MDRAQRQQLDQQITRRGDRPVALDLAHNVVYGVLPGRPAGRPYEIE